MTTPSPRTVHCGDLWHEPKCPTCQAEAIPREALLRAALLDVLNLKHNAFDKQGFPCQCKAHERARKALTSESQP